MNNALLNSVFRLYIRAGMCLLCFFAAPLYAADENAPWGTAEILDIQYPPSKVLYDLTSGEKDVLASVLDRVSYLNKLYGNHPFDSSIVVVIHGDAIPFFARAEYPRYRELMARAQSLTVGTTIEFRMCRAAAGLLGYQAEDIHGFVKMVPMADAEIVRLQNEEAYAYMR